LKTLEKVIINVSNDLLIYYHSKMLDDSYVLAQNCARRIEQAMKLLKNKQVEALREWKADLQGN
jgi:hypothetical protein